MASPPASACHHWCFTRNNPDEAEDFIPAVAKAECTYVVVGLEKGASGTVHYQGYIELARRRRLTALLKLFKGTAWEGAHWEIRRGTPKEASDYCKKDGHFQTHGTLSRGPGQATLDRWAAALSVARSPTPVWDEVEPQILISHYRSLQAISADACPPQTDQDSCAGLWIMGPTGTGKTTTARRLAGLLGESVQERPFIKEPTKWWDGYRGEGTVVLEDFHPSHLKNQPELAAELLLWGDRWTFSAQRKGLPPRLLRPKRFIVTSNYAPDAFFKGPTLAAWRRRAPTLTLLREAPTSTTGWTRSAATWWRLDGGEAGGWAQALPLPFWDSVLTGTSSSTSCGTSPCPSSTPCATATPTSEGTVPSAAPGPSGTSLASWTLSSELGLGCSDFDEILRGFDSEPGSDPFAGYWR